MSSSPLSGDGRLVTLAAADYERLRMLAPQATHGSLTVGDLTLRAEQTLACPEMVAAPVEQVIAAARRYADLTRSANPAPLAVLLFDATGDPWPLTHCFPAIALRDRATREQCFARIGALAARPHLDLRLIGERRRDLTTILPASARWLVAGHLDEVLGERLDLLDALLSRPRHFRLYTSAAAFEDDGGVAGGDYDPRHERIQLGLARLFEGFYARRPGVAPFLHELGHMLDALDPVSGRMTRGNGLLPGLDARDGPLFDAQARHHFVVGKALELRRYEALRMGPTPRSAAAELPVGHPYVFQNDGEFIAGYLELFLRTPNRFAALNPELYAGFATLLRQDPRPAWPEDFGWYALENEAVYRRGEPLAPAGISIPAA